jgi:pentatricopeptide repeat protein
MKATYVVGCTLDIVTYNMLIGLYNKNLMTQEALALLQKMHDAGCIPDAITFGSYIWVMGTHMWEAAVAILLLDMEKTQCKPTKSTFHVLIDVHQWAGKCKQAEIWYPSDRSAGFEPSPATLHMLMGSFGNGGEPEQLRQCLTRA